MKHILILLALLMPCLAMAQGSLGNMALQNKGAVDIEGGTISGTTIDGTNTITLANGSVTNLMLANSTLTIGSTNIALGATQTTLSGLASVTSASFVGPLTGNATSANVLATPRNINGVAFDGSGNITIQVPVSTGITGLGTNVASALTINVGSAGAFVTFNGAGGTPSSMTATNLSGTAANLTSGITLALKSATTTVDVSAATAPTVGQALVATSATAATWQTPAGGGDVLGPATNSDDFVPVWNGANSKTLENGFATSTTGVLGDAGKIVRYAAAGVLNATTFHSSDTADQMDYGANGIGFSHFSSGFGMTVAWPSLTATRAQEFQDKDGLIAVTTDIPADPNFLAGLVITSNATDPTNDIDIASGSARNSADTVYMTAAALIKQQDAVWAVGTNAGGMYQSANLAGTITTVSTTAVVGTGTAFLTDFVVGDVIVSAGGVARRIVTVTDNTNMVTTTAMGTEAGVTYKRGGMAANTVYFVYLIRRSDTGVVDAFFTTRNPSQTVTLPTSYDASRLIGGFHNNGTPAVNGIFNGDGISVKSYTTLDLSTTVTTNLDTGMHFYSGANEVWWVDVKMTVTNGTGGAKFQITAPTGGGLEMHSVNDINGVAGPVIRLTAVNTLTVQATNSSLTTASVSIRGYFTNGSTAGTVAIGYASTTNGQTSTIILKSGLSAGRR